VLEGKPSLTSARDRPHSLETQAARIVMSNYRSSETGTPAELTTCINAINSLRPDYEELEPQIPQRFFRHANGNLSTQSVAHENVSELLS
jgi:hypothetical protein